ncbi:esterase FE4-like [Danaus plexippus]|uniref:esterase FE4-like n=1 Tax=Danaus plexippus TaxID=13037 RepID=UPI002AB159B8|nr:esterase FE4-like [Danaus plexippus]
MRSCIVLLSVLLASVLSEDVKDRESLLVQINSGLVRGYKDPKNDIFVFNGIPYATAPTGTERFKGPLPPPAWMSIFEAVDDRTICPQINVKGFIPDSMIMKEDCLVANVYVPKTKKKNLPVVVYVHGGAFLSGFGTLLTPKELVSSQTVLAVTFNYRLGAHGFLCLGTKDVPGNAGMKDQVALLRWVRKNIAGFGGNPNDVTIAGYSAGSSSVDLLMLSKMAEGLFHKVIPESGASTSPFSMQVDPIQNAKEYAKLIDIENVDDILEMEKSFKKVSYEVLQSGNLAYRKDFTFLFAPCIERDSGQEMFLTDDPVNILNRSDFPKLPMLYGFANMEGLMLIESFELWKNEMNENFANFLPANLKFKSEEEKVLTANKIRKFYFGDSEVDNNAILQYIDYRSDGYFTCPTIRVVNHLVKAGHSEIYLYEYSYTDEYTPVIPYTNVRGAPHCAQSDAVLDGFGTTLSKRYSYTDDFVSMKSLMRELWGNFIKNGKPAASGTPMWPAAGLNGSPHMALKKDPEIKGALLEERCLFWNEIYDSYYKFSEPPSRSIRRNTEL